MSFFLKRKLLFTIIIVIFLLFIGYTKVNQQLEIEKLTEDKARLEADIERLELLKQVLKEELKNIDSNEYIEEYARSRLRMIKENEMIFIVNEN